MNVTLYILGSVLGVSIISLAGVSLFALHRDTLGKSLIYLVSFSTGALFGNAFLHLLPEVIEMHESLVQAMLLVLGGILISFIIENFIHWRHCHDADCDEHAHPVGVVNLIGDAAHNIVDGILIAGAFLVSVPLGIATTLAVALHEIPQEISEFAILLHSGFSRGRAILFNLLSAFTAFFGAFLVLATNNSLPNIEMYLLPLTAGNFLYIAGSDLIPELHKSTKLRQTFLQLVFMIVGIGLMYQLNASGDPHGHGEEEEEHDETEVHLELDEAL